MRTTFDLAEPSAAASAEEAAARPSGKDDVERAIEDFQAGRDRDRSFQLLFESYYRPLQRFFARKGLPPESCLDLTQETMLGIYRGLEAYRPEARFETWIYKIATTTYLKSLRSQTTAKRSGEEVSAEQVAGAEPALEVPEGQLDDVLGKERREALRKAVAELPEQMRKCLTLRVYHDLSYRDIAVAMQLSIETVKAHLHQGRRRLKERLSAYGEPGIAS